MGHNKSKFKDKLGHYYGKDHSILNLNLDEFFKNLRSIFGQSSEIDSKVILMGHEIVKLL